MQRTYEKKTFLLRRMDDYIEHKAAEWSMLSNCLSLDYFVEPQRQDPAAEFVSPFAKYVSQLREASDSFSSMMASHRSHTSGHVFRPPPLAGQQQKKYSTAEQAVRSNRNLFARTDGFARLRDEVMEKATRSPYPVPADIARRSRERERPLCFGERERSLLSSPQGDEDFTTGYGTGFGSSSNRNDSPPRESSAGGGSLPFWGGGTSSSQGQGGGWEETYSSAAPLSSSAKSRTLRKDLQTTSLPALSWDPPALPAVRGGVHHGR